MKQYVVTPAMGKRLIGKAMAHHPAVAAAMTQGTLAIIAGTTNGYVAEEILADVGHDPPFNRKGFRRGMVVPPDFSPAGIEAKFGGDVIFVDGVWQPGKTIFDVADDLRSGDVVLKGANALDLARRQAGLYIGHPQAGTLGSVIGALAGRRVRMIVPVGLEKRVDTPIMELVAMINAPDTQGPGMLPMPGEAFCELDAIKLLTGADAHLLAAGGVYGAEGAVWIGVSGADEHIEAAATLITSVAGEPPCVA